MNRKFLTILTTIFALVVGLASCSSDNEPVPCDPTDELVTLMLDLSVNGGTSAKRAEGASVVSDLPDVSRALSRAGDGVDFEEPTYAWEKVKELRVIIVRPNSNNLIEHNIYATYDDVWETLDLNEIKVVGGEPKRIYLIANESGLPDGLHGRIPAVKTGDYFPAGLASLTIDVTAGQPLIDNTATGDKPVYIPMTEIFDITVPDAATIMAVDGKKIFRPTFNLFVTRAASKFSFAVRRKENTILSRGLQITSITFSGKQTETGLGTQEYLFPRNTMYVPSKYTVSTEKLNGREIVSYAVPPTSETYSYTFTPANFGLSGTILTDLDQVFFPAEYFLESGMTEFTVSITTRTPVNDNPDDDIITAWNPATLDNLPNLPRNTHVAVLLTLTDGRVDAVVKLVPWIGVTLEYTFGFDKLIPWTRPNNGSVLPV